MLCHGNSIICHFSIVDDSAVVSVPAVCPGCDVVCPTDEGSWEDDMNDDLLKLLIRKAHCFEAEIRYNYTNVRCRRWPRLAMPLHCWDSTFWWNKTQGGP